MGNTKSSTEAAAGTPTSPTSGAGSGSPGSAPPGAKAGAGANGYASPNSLSPNVLHTPPLRPARTNSAPPTASAAGSGPPPRRPSNSTSRGHRARLRQSSSSAGGVASTSAAVIPMHPAPCSPGGAGCPPLHSRPSSPLSLCANCHMMATPAVTHAHSGSVFCCKECHVSWAERLGIDDAEAQAPLSTAAALAAAAEWQRGTGKRTAVISQRPVVPDSYVENRHEQIRRRGSSLGHSAAAGGGAQGSPHSRTRSVSRSNTTTPRLAPIGEPAGGASDGPLTSPRSLLASSSCASRSLQSMCVEEFDEELDSAVPSPPVRIPPAKPIHSLKPFALPPPARY